MVFNATQGAPTRIEAAKKPQLSRETSKSSSTTRRAVRWSCWGNLGTSGSVAFQFERKGQIVVAKEILDENAKKETMIANGAAGDEDEFMMAIAEAGGEDYEDAGEEWIVWTAANDVMAVSKALEEQGIQVKGSETTMVPTTPTEVSGADAKKVQRLIDRLEELDDVQDVYSTMDMTDEVIAALEEE